MKRFGLVCAVIGVVLLATCWVWSVCTLLSSSDARVAYVVGVIGFFLGLVTKRAMGLAPDGERREKDARIYYQDIVYDVCNVLDAIERRRITRGEGIVCGTPETPATVVQEAMCRVKADIQHLRESRKGGRRALPSPLNTHPSPLTRNTE